MKKGLVFGFVFLLVLTTVFGVLPTETHAAIVNDDPGAGQRGTPPPDTDGSFWGIKEAFESALKTFLTVIAEGLLMMSSFILGVAGLLLNTALELSVVKFHTYANSPGVILAWETFRDIANMFFIFILLYIAIGTILGLGSINLKKMLARIIIVAVLLNFSLFFTKVIIDASNILAVGFHNQITQTSCGDGPAKGISNAFMCKMGIANLYSTQTFNDIRAKEPLQILSYGVFGSIFMIIAAFIFMAAAIMFIARTIIFIFLLILSPLAFTAMALPNDKYSKEWWNKLFEQCIFAPAFVAFLWVTLQVVGPLSLNLDISGAINTNAGAEVEDSVGKTVLNFGIIIGLLIASLVVAKRTGAYGAGGAMKMLNKAGKGVQNKLRAVTGGMTLGVAGYTGRRIIGAGGRMVADSEKLKELQSKGGFWGRALAGATRGVAKKTAETSFDARTVVGGLGKAGGKGGFDKFKEERDKAAVKKEQELKPSKEKIDQAQEKLYRLKERVGNEAKIVQTKEREYEEQIRPEKQELERMEAELETNKKRLESPLSSEPEKTQIQNNIAHIEEKMLKARTALQFDTRTIELNKTKKTLADIREEMQPEIDAAQAKVDELRGVDEKEAGKRFKSSGKEDEAIKQAEGKGLTGENYKNFLNKAREEFIEKNKKDSRAKIRALDYARKSVEKSWIGLIRGTRKSEAAAIRIDITKDKDDKKWEKLTDTLKKMKGGGDVEKKPDMEPEEEQGDKT